MDVKELQIGDFVRVNRDGLCIKKDTIVTIRSIDADNRVAGTGLIGSAGCRPLDESQFDGGIWCEYLDPILITKELLEKNGFKLDKNETYCKRYFYAANLDQVPQTVVEFTFYGEGISVDTLFKCWTKPMSCDGENSIHICDLKYVHELQHSLKDCRIDKGIELL